MLRKSTEGVKHEARGVRGSTSAPFASDDRIHVVPEALMGEHNSGADLMDPRNPVMAKPSSPICNRNHQPRDQGVTAAWKTYHKTQLLMVRVNTTKSAYQLHEQALARGVAVGTMGLSAGHQSHTLGTAEAVSQAWDKKS